MNLILIIFRRFVCHATRRKQRKGDINVPTSKAHHKAKVLNHNRQLFLMALRSGDYLKGPIENDAMGRPIDLNAEGWCAVGLAFTIFCEEQKGSHKILRDALGLTGAQLTHIQQEWNDSPLTFPEIADLIADQMFNIR